MTEQKEVWADIEKPLEESEGRKKEAEEKSEKKRAKIRRKKTGRELRLERLEQAYKPGLLGKILNYIRAKRKAKVYLFLSALFLIYLIFRNKSSIIGYTVVETVTSNYLGYFLVFILVVCLIAFLIDKE